MIVESQPWIPDKTKNKNKNILDWNLYMKQYQLEIKFWFNIWQSAGTPQTGDLFESMKFHNEQYKFAVRCLKRCQNIL